ncbi:MAG: Dabb family protein [Verrucomicrobia bacterium]|nr:Dabb family protein [Verrucomicrobiota bacterium]
MFSHVVIFWTKPGVSRAVEDLLDGAERYLRPIPGMLHFHVGKMVASPRGVVDQTYQVALNISFPAKKAHDQYQAHPLHLEFIEKVFERCCKAVVVYDFE